MAPKEEEGIKVFVRIRPANDREKQVMPLPMHYVNNWIEILFSFGLLAYFLLDST